MGVCSFRGGAWLSNWALPRKANCLDLKLRFTPESLSRVSSMRAFFFLRWEFKIYSSSESNEWSIIFKCRPAPAKLRATANAQNMNKFIFFFSLFLCSFYIFLWILITTIILILIWLVVIIWNQTAAVLKVFESKHWNVFMIYLYAFIWYELHIHMVVAFFFINSIG